jgi:hypothetical protein
MIRKGWEWVDKAQRRVILFRDISCIVGGLVMLYQQTFVAVEASVVLVPAAVSLILAPTAQALLAQRNSAGPSTTEQSSSQVQPPEPQPSSPSQ